MNVRNLDDIQEQDRPFGSPRVAALLLASLAGAAIVTAVVVMGRRGGPPVKPTHDPLAALVQKAKSAPPAPEKLAADDVSFPGILSDDASPTTALAAVRDEHGRLIEPAASAPPSPPPPPPTDRLPVVPLPVGDLLGATPVTTKPKDELTTLAADVAKIPANAELAPPGMDGGFQLQVASFKDEKDAERLVQDLRRRGHSAFSQTAEVPNRGTWHRVRIGPFKTKYEALKYKRDFDRTERASSFLVDPDKVRRAEEIRAARIAARERKERHRRAP